MKGIVERESKTRTAWAVVCRGIDPEVGAGPCNNGELIFLTREEYVRQMNNPSSLWKCPRCNAPAYWDDDNFESFEGI